MNQIKTVGIAGAGTMGSGIAQVFAQAGKQVVLFDPVESSLVKARANISDSLTKAVSKEKITEQQKLSIEACISYVSEVDKLYGDFIIEAIVENLDAKRGLFKQLAVNNPDAIFATNTSTIPVTLIANGIPKPERVVGVHFFNPAQLMKLVEVISGVETDSEVAQRAYDLVETCGKSPIKVNDAPGFIVNRVARPFYTESQKIVEEHVASVEDTDKLLESVGFKMGAFKLMDLIGNDVNFAVTKSLYEQFFYEPRFRPSRLQERLVAAGHLGRKSGRGFYSYA